MNHEQNQSLLREDRIVETIAVLQQRISDRFPDSSLAALCGQLNDVAKQASERAEWIGKPIRPLRFAGYAMAVVLMVSFVSFVAFGIQSSESERIGFLDLIQAVESGLNDIVFFAIAIWFLISLETRIKRRRAIAAVHELRSLAHVVDMHQLTKDPERVLRAWRGTEHSPQLPMSPQELNRYLDYCSEMLSLIGKIASLYVQRFDDSEAVAAVSEIEQLSTGLSRKIWQKIMILNQTRELQQQREEPSRSVDSATQPTDTQPTDTQPTDTQPT